MNVDQIDIEILEDGTLAVTSGDVSEANHMSADELLEELEREMGGSRTTKKREHPFLKGKRVLRGGRIVKA